MTKKKSQLKFIIAMLIFGSIGLFVKAINLPSDVIVLMRTIVGSIFIALVMLIGKQRVNKKGIISNLPVLILSGLVLGGNWAFLFEAYKYTTVSAATLIYYCAPIIVFLLSPIIFKEKLTVGKIVGVIMAIIGMAIVNGIGIGGSNPSLGLICGIVSAVFYATLMIVNKFIKDLSGLEITLSQLIVAAIVMLTYVLIVNKGMFSFGSSKEIALLVTVGIVHTGIACYLYFSSMQSLPSQSIAMLSYIDPVSALLFSGVFLGERLSVLQLLGAILILGGTAFSQIYKRKNKNTISI